MSAPDEALEVVRQWVERAEHDLKNAEHTLQLEADCPFDTICFHAQQCAEKYPKAILTHRRIPFPRTHDLSELLARLPAEIRCHMDATELVELNPYAVETRYPGDWEALTREDAVRAVEIAQRVRSSLRPSLTTA